MEYNNNDDGDGDCASSMLLPIELISTASSDRWLEATTANETDVSFNDAQVLQNTFVVYGPILAFSFFFFCYLRRQFPRVYNLRSWVDDLQSPLAANQYGWLSWIYKMNGITDDELLKECGLDSLCFLRLLRMGFKVAAFSIFNAIWLMPLYATAPGDDVTSQITDNVVRLTIAHVPDGSKRLIGTVIAAYILFGYVMYLIFHEFHWFTQERHKYLRAPTVQNHSVYVHNVPPEYRSNDKLEQYFKQCFSDQSILEARLRIKAPTLQKAVQQRDALVAKLQHALNYEQVKQEAPMHREKRCGPKVESIPVYANQLKEANETVSNLIDEIHANANNAVAPTPRSLMGLENDIEQPAQEQSQEQEQEHSLTTRHWQGQYDEARITCTAAAVAVAAAHSDSMTANEDEEYSDMNLHPIDDNDNDNNNKSTSLLGQSVNLLKSKTSQGVSVLASTTQGVAHVISETKENEYYAAGFVTFSTLAVANAALQMVHHQTPFAFQTAEAPRPDDTFWMNVGRTHQNLQIGKLIGLVGTIALCLLWTIPMAFIASLSSVEALSKEVPFIGDLIARLPWLGPLFEILAPLLIKVVNALLPTFVMILTLLEGPVSGSIVEASNFVKLSCFMIIQTFFVSAVSSSLLQSIEGLIENPTSIVRLLAETLPAQSTYFIQIVFVGTVVASAMEILRIIPLILAFIRRFLPPNLTEEERQTTVMGIRPLADPAEFEHADNHAQIVLNFIVLLVYAVIAPLTVFIQSLCFIYMLVVYKHQFIYIYPKYPDSGGKVWMNFMNLLIACVFIAEFTIIGLMGLKRSVIAVPMMIPLIVVTFLFNAYIHKEHFRVAEFLPSRECLKADLCIMSNDDSSLPKDAYLQDELQVKEKYPDNLTEERAAELGLPFRMDPVDENNDDLLGDDSMSYFSCENNPSSCE